MRLLAHDHATRSFGVPEPIIGNRRIMLGDLHIGEPSPGCDCGALCDVTGVAIRSGHAPWHRWLPMGAAHDG